jgi:hypothetical protein
MIHVFTYGTAQRERLQFCLIPCFFKKIPLFYILFGMDHFISEVIFFCFSSMNDYIGEVTAVLVNRY